MLNALTFKITDNTNADRVQKDSIISRATELSGLTDRLVRKDGQRSPLARTFSSLSSDGSL